MRTARATEAAGNEAARNEATRDAAGKAWRLLVALYAFVDFRELDARLARLQRSGIAPRIPNRPQLIAGAIDMLRFWVFPSAGAYYEERDSSFAAERWQKLLEDPSAVVDPVGLFTSKAGIVGHLVETAHDNPQYDLELLTMWVDGVETLEKELDQLLAGTHPRAAAIVSVIEEADYHARLRAYVARWRADRRARFHEERTPTDVERTFGSLSGAMRYAVTLPSSYRGAVRHLLSVRTFIPR